MRIKKVALLCCITTLISFAFGVYTQFPVYGYPTWYLTTLYLLNAINTISCAVFFYLFYKRVK